MNDDGKRREHEVITDGNCIGIGIENFVEEIGVSS
jgi:hypothetical protein